MRDLLDGDGALLAAVQDAGGVRRRGVLVSFQIQRIFQSLSCGRVKVNNSAAGQIQAKPFFEKSNEINN